MIFFWLKTKALTSGKLRLWQIFHLRIFPSNYAKILPSMHWGCKWIYTRWHGKLKSKPELQLSDLSLGACSALCGTWMTKHTFTWFTRLRVHTLANICNSLCSFSPLHIIFLHPDYLRLKSAQWAEHNKYWALRKHQLPPLQAAVWLPSQINSTI